VIADIMGRPQPDARMIIVANEKGGAGKSTIAFHLCAALADAGLKVAAIDLDRRQQTLPRVLQNRDSTARRLATALPIPRQINRQMPSGSVLC
jgi:chromosome partitioning protein